MKEKIAHYFNTWKHNECFATTDGQLFHKKTDAVSHAGSLKEKKITMYLRGEAVKEAEETEVEKPEDEKPEDQNPGVEKPEDEKPVDETVNTPEPEAVMEVVAEETKEEAAEEVKAAEPEVKIKGGKKK